MYGEDRGASQTTAIVVETVPLPLTVAKPEFESGWRDLPFAIGFWVHFLVVFVAACWWGNKALTADGDAAAASTSLGAFDFNAVVMMRVRI